MKYKGVIWTNHILERMKQRNLSYDDIFWVYRKPDEAKASKAKNGFKFYRNHKNTRYVLVTKKNDKGEWVFLSCWSKPLFIRPTKSKQISFWRNLWNMIKGK